MKHLQSKYNNVEIDQHFEHKGLNNFIALSRMASCKEIAISRSTYSWWGAFLSDAERVYYPVIGDEEYFNEKKLFVHDEQRYSKIFI